MRKEFTCCIHEKQVDAAYPDVSNVVNILLRINIALPELFPESEILGLIGIIVTPVLSLRNIFQIFH